MDFDVKSYLEKGYNIGLACCQSGLIVLDADVDESRGLNGLKTIREFEMQLGTLPKTLTVQTPRDGRHFIFSSRGIDNPVGKIGKDIDVSSMAMLFFHRVKSTVKVTKLLTVLMKTVTLLLPIYLKSGLNTLINVHRSIRHIKTIIKVATKKKVLMINFRTCLMNVRLLDTVLKMPLLI